MPTIPDFNKHNDPDNYKIAWLSKRFKSAKDALDQRDYWSVRVQRMDAAVKGSGMVATFLLTVLGTIASLADPAPDAAVDLYSMNQSQLISRFTGADEVTTPSKTVGYIAAVIGALLSLVILTAEIDQLRYKTAIKAFDEAFEGTFIKDNAERIWGSSFELDMKRARHLHRLAMHHTIFQHLGRPPKKSSDIPFADQLKNIFKVDIKPIPEGPESHFYALAHEIKRAYGSGSTKTVDGIVEALRNASTAFIRDDESKISPDGIQDILWALIRGNTIACNIVVLEPKNFKSPPDEHAAIYTLSENIIPEQTIFLVCNGANHYDTIVEPTPELLEYVATLEPSTVIDLLTPTTVVTPATPSR